MNYYQILLKNGCNIFVQADYFYDSGSPDAIFFRTERGDCEELVAYFKLEEIIGCTKISKEELSNTLNFWKENDNYGKRRDS